MKAELFFERLHYYMNQTLLMLSGIEIALSDGRGLSKLIDKRIDSLIQGILEKSTGYQMKMNSYSRLNLSSGV